MSKGTRVGSEKPASRELVIASASALHSLSAHSAVSDRLMSGSPFEDVCDSMLEVFARSDMVLIN